MASVEWELQTAIFARLTGYSALTALVAQRVYDNPPADAQYPYVTIGEADTLRNDATCVNGRQVNLTLHAWSTYPGGYKEVKQIADAVVEALHDYSLTLATNKLISISHRQTLAFRDADGISSHAVIRFVAYTERP